MKKIYFAVFFGLMTLNAAQAPASDTDEAKAGTGLPVPRFASLRSGNANVRAGPGTRYPIEWVYTHQGFPVEIIAEYDIWRRVRDPEGVEGWVHKTELAGKRMGMVTGTPHDLLREADDKAAVMAHVEIGAVGQILSCAKDWCKLRFEDGTKGYLPKTAFWGAYPNEVFD